MKKDPDIYLEHILESIDYIEEYVDGMSKGAFKEEVETQDAVIRRFQVIGEATKNIPDSVQEEYSDVLWHEIISMRNRLVHEYFGVDLDIVWDTANNDLDPLREQIEKALNDTQNDE